MKLRRIQMCFRPGTPGWWICIFVAAFFAFYIHYVPIHLVREHHLGDSLAEQRASADDPAGFVKFDGPEDHHHLPHLASDHALRLASQSAQPLVLLDFAPITIDLAVCAAQTHLELFLTERQNPPGLALTGPSEPRAPPIG